MSEPDCIFCKIARGEIDADGIEVAKTIWAAADVVHDEDEVLAFHDINGRAPVHVLIIPRQHVGSLEEVTQLPESVARRLFEVSSMVAERLGVGESGYAVRINNGPDAGQEVFHLHLHVLGGKRLGMP